MAGVLKSGRLRWFRHLERTGYVDNWILACRIVMMTKMRCVGRKNQGECMKDDMEVLGLQPNWEVFRDMWRDFIHGANVRI